MPRARALCFRRISQPVVARPPPLGNLSVTFTESHSKIKRILFVRLFVMRRFVEFRDLRPSCERRRHTESLRPVDHALVQIGVPLAAYVIAQAHGPQVVEVAHSRGNYVVHISIPGGTDEYSELNERQGRTARPSADYQRRLA